MYQIFDVTTATEDATLTAELSILIHKNPTHCLAEVDQITVSIA